MRNKMALFMLLVAILFVVGIAGCGGGGGGGDSDNGELIVTPSPDPGTPTSPTVPGDSTAPTVPGTPTSPTVPGDSTAPQVSSTTPAHGGVSATDSDITVTFNEKMDGDTITPDTFYLESGSNTNVVTATVEYFEDNKTAVLRPVSDLSPNTEYIATVLSSVTDLAGNDLVGNSQDLSYTWAFTTGAGADNTPPLLDHTFPAAGQPDVARNTSLVATMSEAIDPDTINNQNFILQTGDSTSVDVAGSVTNVGTNLIFKPMIPLAENSTYMATLTNDIKDLAGNSFAGYSWSFSTGSSFDNDPPQIVSVSPDRDQQNVLLDADIQIEFNEPIMPFEYGLIEGRPVRVSSNETYTVVTLTTDTLFEERTSYTASIRVSDMAGNWMDEAHTWEFITINP